ncbi:MAG: hypothetical protein IIX69_00695 [Clostridia bacterium]|nr:hypothetical protein [Clostridia bacterium]MBQ1934850.1 hypothetical protein [Clostridia bacterium]MBQ5808343.1 hypothetical protein [Clostridia bacterium]MBR0326707.1 hypothetical protein [Clostridia bacterium]
MKRRLLIIFVTAFLLLSLYSCNTSDKPLEKAGEEVIALMREMTVSEEYEKLYGLHLDYGNAVAKLREGDYTEASAVYELDVPVGSMLSVEMNSDNLEEYVTSAAYVSFASRVNQAAGVEALSVAAAYSAQITFVNTELKENTVYLYVFENGYPITVAFIPGEDGAVRAVGYFMLNDSLLVESSDDIENSLADLGVVGVKATKK